MREILFRGKRIDNGEWVYGFLAQYIEGIKAAICPIVLGVVESAHFYMVDPATVGQFTGLRDRKGNRIFEGDVLQQKRNGVWGTPFTVIFEDGAFMWSEHGRTDFLYQSICDNCKIVTKMD